MGADSTTTVWPVTVDEFPGLSLGDKFTMEVPVHPETGVFPWPTDQGGVMRTVEFRVAKVIKAKAEITDAAYVDEPDRGPQPFLRPRDYR